jgi:hypothetical protein
MPQNKFYNNRSTTLTASLASGATTLPVASLLADPLATAIAAGTVVTATLSNAAGTLVEIISLTASAGGATPTSYTISRGQQGTVDLSWNIGDSLKLNLTAAELDKFAQTFYADVTALSNGIQTFQSAVYAAVAANINRPDSTVVAKGSLYVAASGQTLVYFLEGGTTAASSPFYGGFGSKVSINQDGSAVGMGIPIQSNGTLDPIFGLGDSFGQDSYAIFFDSLAISGKPDTFAQGERSLAINGKALGNDSVAINGVALGIKSSAYGGQSILRYGLGTSGIAEKPANAKVNTVDGAFSQYDSNLQSIVWSEPCDFTGGATWTATTQVKHGYVMKPTAGGSRQFVRIDNNYHSLSKAFSAGYVAGSTGATQPTWPVSDRLTVADGGGSWFALSNVGRTLRLNSLFLVQEIGIVIFDWSAITAQPFVSFGINGNNTLFVPSTQTTKLTASNTAQFFTPVNPTLATDLTMSIDTLAVGTRMLGQVFFRGFYCPAWF